MINNGQVIAIHHSWSLFTVVKQTCIESDTYLVYVQIGKTLCHSVRSNSSWLIQGFMPERIILFAKPIQNSNLNVLSC